MLRKPLSILILVAMTLHCCGRLGILSYLYTNRSDIAYSLGITADKVISTCSGEYFQLTQLTLPSDVESHVPVGIPQADEINLSIPPIILTITGPAPVSEMRFSDSVPTLFTSWYADIFHPPGFFS